MEFHSLSKEEAANKLQSNAEGLTSQQATDRLQQHGPNEIEAKKKKTWWGILLSQFTDFMIIILMAAAVISGFIGDSTDMIVIFAIVLLNAVVGFIQEWRAEKAIEALQQMAASKARVMREKKPIDIEASKLVPGDVVLLEAGNVIPADVRLAESHSLKVDESSLTGESVNIDKTSDALPAGEYSLGDRVNMGYKGTFITHGRGSGYVVATGMKTELGKIAEMIQTDDTKTPLQKKLARFAKQLTVIILVLCAIFFGVGWARGEDWNTMMMTSISLAVAAIPEALPALVTVALALGAKRLVKSNALIRKLPAVETLGSVTYICSDKTGTLTLNKMTVQELFRLSDQEKSKEFGDRDLLFMAMALNNDVTKDGDKFTGESTEVALVQHAFENGFVRDELEKEFRRIAELPFDSTRKRMTTLHQTSSGVIAITKGAVEELVHQLKSDQQNHIREIDEKSDEMASKGFRTLGFAYRLFKEKPANINPEEIETSLTFIGFAGLIDPPREEVKQAVKEAKDAGIISVMITGDHKLTAQAIAKALGILSDENEKIITGSEFEKMSDDEFLNVVEDVRVYARVSPQQKLRIIHALQKKDHFVAMTGDGVNDAPALKNADIGVAMGINGTEVSKEAAHMILLDDNFSTIVVAVRHGRRIYDNILKFIKYIMTGNSGEIWAIFLAPLFGLPIPLLAIQILWVNLVSDGLPGLALASEPAEATIMKRPPRNPKENLFAGTFGLHILFMGLLIGLITLATQWWAIANDDAHWQTMTFTVLCFAQLFHVIGIRSTDRSIFRIGFFSNKSMVIALIVTVLLQLMIIYTPFFNKVFHTQPLTLNEMLITIAISSATFWAVELAKFWTPKKK
jgi:P-type Ca2+ transporter type 2C